MTDAVFQTLDIALATTSNILSRLGLAFTWRIHWKTSTATINFLKYTLSHLDAFFDVSPCEFTQPQQIHLVQSQADLGATYPTTPFLSNSSPCHCVRTAGPCQPGHNCCRAHGLPARLAASMWSSASSCPHCCATGCAAHPFPCRVCHPSCCFLCAQLPCRSWGVPARLAGYHRGTACFGHLPNQLCNAAGWPASCAYCDQRPAACLQMQCWWRPSLTPAPRGFERPRQCAGPPGSLSWLRVASTLPTVGAPRPLPLQTIVVRPAAGSPQLLPSQGSCYGLSAVSACHAAAVCPFVWRSGLPPCWPLLATPSALVGSSQPLHLPHVWCSMRNLKWRIIKPAASSPAGILFSPAVSCAKSLYNMYMESMAVLASLVISPWVAANTLPVCESPILSCAQPAHPLPAAFCVARPLSHSWAVPPKPTCLDTSWLCEQA